MPSSDHNGSSTEIEGRKTVYLLKPRGFCAGVVRAIDIVELALKVFGPPIYVRKEIVHNRFVVKDLASRGAIFIDELDDAPGGSRVVFSAHGVAPEVRKRASARGLQVIDATCPLVTKVHLEAVRFARTGGTIFLIGHRDHDEVIGTLGEAPAQTIVVSSVEEARTVQPPTPDRLYYLTQTTLSLDEAGVIIAELTKRFPRMQGPPAQDICYATENRQRAVKRTAEKSDLLLVVGSENSSNSRRLVEVGEIAGTTGYLIDDESNLQPEWFDSIRTVSITAGASAPEVLVNRVIQSLARFGFDHGEEVEVVEEDVKFALPPELAPFENQLTTIANA